MLESVPAVGSQGKVVDRREVPEPRRRREDQPGGNGVRQGLEDPAEKCRPEQGGDPGRADRPGQPAQHRKQRRTQPKERRSDHDQQQVLQHVGL